MASISENLWVPACEISGSWCMVLKYREVKDRLKVTQLLFKHPGNHVRTAYGFNFILINAKLQSINDMYCLVVLC